jgi:transcriptional regulator with XRE-family HTH domain
MGEGEVMESLGSLLARARERKRMTLREVASRVGLSVSHVSDIEHGRRSASLETACKLGKVFGYGECTMIQRVLSLEIERVFGTGKFVVSVDKRMSSDE